MMHLSLKYLVMIVLQLTYNNYYGIYCSWRALAVLQILVPTRKTSVQLHRSRPEKRRINWIRFFLNFKLHTYANEFYFCIVMSLCI